MKVNNYIVLSAQEWGSSKLLKDVNISSVESQKGVIAVQRCSVENQKGAIAIDFDSDSALLVLNGTSLNCNNALLALN